jgi:hypothetical protein
LSHPRRDKNDPPVDRSYLSEQPPPNRSGETSDGRRARQRAELEGQQAELKREAAERRARDQT